MPPINLVLGLAALRPTEVGGTVGGLSPRRRLVSLPLPPLFGHALLPVSQLAGVYHLLISFIHSPTPHPLISFCRYKVLVYDVITIHYQCEDLVYDVTLKFLRVYFTTYGRAFYVFSGF